MPEPRENARAAEDPHLTCPDCRATFMGRPGDTCPKCGAKVGERIGLPWQNRKKKGLGRWRALFRTIRQLHRPRQGFIDLQTERPWWEVVLFQAHVAFILWSCLSLLMLGFFAWTTASTSRTHPRFWRHLGYFSRDYWSCFAACQGALLVFAVTFYTFMASLFGRVCSVRKLFMLGGYSTGAPVLWLLVPLLPFNFLMPPLLAVWIAVTGARMLWPELGRWRILTTGAVAAIVLTGIAAVAAVFAELSHEVWRHW